MEAPLALYRRYRPETFAEVIGQEHVTAPLRNALSNNRVNHAYLFSGPRGCGKTTSARILARAINCEKGPIAEPCGVCKSCTDLARGGPGSIDVIEIDAASHGGVDDARDLRERAFFAPVESRYKIYIIDEAHMVTTQGFNALLKLVEEPPPHLKFIFATTEPDKVIGTIRSRTHHYPFRLVPPKVLADYMATLCEAEGVAIESAALPLVVRAGAGSVRDSLSVLDQLIGGAGPAGVTYELAVALLGFTPDSLLDACVDGFAAHDSAAVFETIEKVIETGQDPKRFAEDLLRRLRDLVVLSAVPTAVTSGLIEAAEDQGERLQTQAAGIGPAELTRAADIVAAGLLEMRGATAPRLQLELICAKVLLPGADDSTNGIQARLDRMERRLAIGVPSGTTESAPAPAGTPDSAPAPVGTPGRAQPPAPGAGPAADSATSRAAARAAASGTRAEGPNQTPPAASSPAAAGPAVGQVAGHAQAEGSPAGHAPGEGPAEGHAQVDGSETAAPSAGQAAAPTTDGPSTGTPGTSSGPSTGAAGAGGGAGEGAAGGGRGAGAGASDGPSTGAAGAGGGAGEGAPGGAGAGAAGVGGGAGAGALGGSGGAGAGGSAGSGQNVSGGAATPGGVSAGEGRTGAWGDEPVASSAPPAQPSQVQPAAVQPGAAQPAQGGYTQDGQSGLGGQAGGGGVVGLADVRRLWPEVLDAVKAKRRFAWIMLSQNAQVIAIDDQTLTLGLVNAGARESFARSGSDEILRQAMIDTIGINRRVEAVVDPSTDPGAGGGSTPRPGPQPGSPQAGGPQAGGGQPGGPHGGGAQPSGSQPGGLQGGGSQGGEANLGGPHGGGGQPGGSQPGGSQGGGALGADGYPGGGLGAGQGGPVGGGGSAAGGQGGAGSDLGGSGVGGAGSSAAGADGWGGGGQAGGTGGGASAGGGVGVAGGAGGASGAGARGPGSGGAGGGGRPWAEGAGAAAVALQEPPDSEYDDEPPGMDPWDSAGGAEPVRRQPSRDLAGQQAGRATGQQAGEQQAGEQGGGDRRQQAGSKRRAAEAAVAAEQARAAAAQAAAVPDVPLTPEEEADAIGEDDQVLEEDSRSHTDLLRETLGAQIITEEPN